MTAPLVATVEQDWLLDVSLAPTAGDDPIRSLYDAAARGELALPFCAACDLPVELEQCVCDGCGGDDLRWRPVALHGVVHSATVVHRREPGLVHAEHPYPVIDVEVSSGHRLIMTTTAPSQVAPVIGAVVQIGFRSFGGQAVPALHILQESEGI